MALVMVMGTSMPMAMVILRAMVTLIVIACRS